MELGTVQTLPCKTLDVRCFITHGRRERLHLAVIAPPPAAWGWRHLVKATAWGRRPRVLLWDRDAVYGGEFARRAAALGSETLLAPVRAARA